MNGPNDNTHTETDDDGRTVYITEHDDGNVTYVQEIDLENDIPDITENDGDE